MIPAKLPYGAEIGEDGVWRQVLTRMSDSRPRPALFLDRDGVLVEEVHYLHKVKDMRLVDGAAALIKQANALSVPTVVVTNQAGIGRGIFDWPAFIEVQEAMLDALASDGAYVNAVYACPHYANGKPPYDVADHPSRKPNPGMLLAAAEMMPITLAGSWIIGDRSGDIEAAKRAGCAGGVHVRSGHGSEPAERASALAQRTIGFDVKEAKSVKDAGVLIPLLNDLADEES